jgi:hypothetical protein
MFAQWKPYNVNNIQNIFNRIKIISFIYIIIISIIIYIYIYIVCLLSESLLACIMNV